MFSVSSGEVTGKSRGYLLVEKLKRLMMASALMRSAPEFGLSITSVLRHSLRSGLCSSIEIELQCVSPFDAFYGKPSSNHRMLLLFYDLPILYRHSVHRRPLDVIIEFDTLPGLALHNGNLRSRHQLLVRGATAGLAAIHFRH